MNYVSNSHDSEEIAQDVFMRVLEKGVGLDPESGRIRNFIYTIARNRAIDFIKKRKNELEKIREAHIEEAVMDQNFYSDIEDIYIEGELISTLHDTINSFPEREKNIYMESMYKCRKDAEVTSEYNISSYKMKKIVHSMNSILRKKISTYI